MRPLLLLSAAMIGLGMTACANANQGTQSDQQPGSEPAIKVLVAYFSASGTTRAVAEQIAEFTNGTLYEIAPAQPYTDADLDWRNKQSRSSVEMADSTSRPAIAGKVENMDSYDVIYLGFPIWWYTCPTIINTFMESYDFTGKIVHPFATSGGSTIDKACADLKAAYPKVYWQKGKLLNNPKRDELALWLNGN